MDTKLTSPWKLLKTAWSLGTTKTNVLLFLGLGALPQLVSFGFSGALAYGLNTNWLETTLTDFFSQTNGWMVALLVLLCVLTIIAAIYVSVWYTAFLYKIYEACASGSRDRLVIYFRSAKTVSWRLLQTSIKVGVYATFGFLLFIIPGIILTVRYSFAPLIAALEESSVSPLSESTRLMKGRFWSLVLRSLVPFALYSVPLSALQSLHPILGLLWSLSSPLFGLYSYLVYLDFKRTAHAE